jgi:Protein phosphatase 2C
MAEGTHITGDVAASPSASAETNTAAVTTSREWRIIGETVPGASHLRAGVPNQDAILQLRESSIGLPLILSISDGHGSKRCFRSDRGSRFAVAVGAGLMLEFLNGRRGGYEASRIEREAGEILPVEFARRWNEAVVADLKREPLSQEEFDRLEAKEGVRARQLVEAYPLMAYGATSLTVALTLSFVIYLQLGDGEIVTFSETGGISKPLPEDERLLANETTSLCSETAAQDFRFALEPLADPPPALIMMSTDGYANSFTDDAGFLKVGKDILGMLRTDGFDAVNRNVKGWLEEATRVGSGDDCTLGIICRMDALQRLMPAESTVTDPSAQPMPPAEGGAGNAVGCESKSSAEQI